MSQKIIILGSNGFIGSWLTRRFQEDGVFFLKALSSQDCDLLRPESIERSLSDLHRDDILVLASAVARLKENSFEALLKNLQMVENLLRTIKDNPPQQIVFLSSVDVYGVLSDDTVIHEELPINPQEYYSIAKFGCESLLRQYGQLNDTCLTVLRLSGVYGPGDDGGKSNINKIFESAVNEGKVCIMGDGKNLRDYVWVDDLYRIIVETVKIRLNDTLNVATGESVCVLEIVDIINTLLSKPCAIEMKNQSMNVRPRTRFMQFDTSLIYRLFPGFKFTPLKEGIRLYLNYQEAIQPRLKDIRLNPDLSIVQSVAREISKTARD